MSVATYKYSLKAESGYKSDQTGKITPERHGVVCAALDGGLSDNLALLRSAPDLLEALEAALFDAENTHPLDSNYSWTDAARAAIARAKGESS